MKPAAVVALFLAIPIARAEAPVDDATFRQIADLFQYDRAMPLDPVKIGTWEPEPGRHSYFIEKIAYRSVRNETVPGYFAYPPGCRHCAAVLLIHGSNDFWGKNEDWVLDWVDVLARSGRGVLVIDNYGFGERIRKTDLEGRERLPFETRDMVVQSVIDQQRALDYLATRAEVDPARIALLGGSRGAWIGSLVAGLDHRLKAVVLTVIGPDEREPYSNVLNFAPRIGAPVMIVAAAKDKPARVAFAKQLMGVLRDPKRLVFYESGHYMAPKNSNKEILEWLDEYLK